MSFITQNRFKTFVFAFILFEKMTNSYFMRKNPRRYDKRRISFSNSEQYFFRNNMNFSIQELFGAFVIKKWNKRTRREKKKLKEFFHKAVARGEIFHDKGVQKPLTQNCSLRFSIQKRSQLQHFFRWAQKFILNMENIFSLLSQRTGWNELKKVFLCFGAII